MKTWTSKGHLSELALELWAAHEAEAHDLQAIESHLQACPACRAQAAEWRGFFLTLASLRGVEPSSSFDEGVMRRARVPAPKRAEAPALVVRLAHRAPRIAAAVIGAWTLCVVGGAAWLQKTVDVPLALLLARFVGQLQEYLIGVAINVVAYLHLSGLAEWWSEFSSSIPGLGVAGALALMTALSGLAIWTLYRVVGYQPPRVDAHA
jgi:predicted anti-sigma-YlaC factor YlaD